MHILPPRCCSTSPAVPEGASEALRGLSQTLLSTTPAPHGLQEIAERYILQPLLAAPVGLAVDLSCAIQAGINELLEMGSREAVYPGGPGQPGGVRMTSDAAEGCNQSDALPPPRTRHPHSPTPVCVPAPPPSLRQSTFLPRRLCAAAPWTSWGPSGWRCCWRAAVGWRFASSPSPV